MPRKTKPQNPVKRSREFYTVHPWQCRRHEDHYEITAYVEASGAWEVVAEVLPTSGASAETMAAYITTFINLQQRKQELLQDAMNVLELVMNDGLNFSSEQAAEHAIDNIKRVIS